ncbi:unnamed protein product [Phyllotreta striolata]|uniref:Major facilitator superfamily (MFS) profile domain-containing protein n=1 Tax=Phyllotreta striolata TaxID=444603 RepID=A0A9P0GNZ6_PHYSR|nr:unnamed protein product [Phyllotreta striolata]
MFTSIETRQFCNRRFVSPSIDKKKKDVKKTGLGYSYFIAFSASLFMLLPGLSFSWPSVCIQKLYEKDPSLNPLGRQATIQEIAWITSLHNLGAIIAPLFCGMISYQLGKKNTILLFAVPHFLSNIILIFANHVWHFYVARFLMGVTTGCAYTIVQIYVVEVVPTNHRGRACSISNFLVSLAQDFLFLIGPYVTITILSAMSLVPTVLLFVLFGKFSPESPYHFVAKGDLGAAEEILIKTRDARDVSNELNSIIKDIGEHKGFSWKEFIMSKGARKSFILMACLVFFQQFSGINCVFAYQQSILAETKSTLSANKSLVIIATVQMISIFITSKLVDMWGRKKLLIFSYAGECLSIFCLGTYFYLLNNNIDVSSLNLLPLFTIITYLFSFKLGSGPLTSVLSVELCPPKYMPILYSLAAFILNLLSYVITLSFPMFWITFGLEVALWGFAITAFMAILFTYFLIPETMGKTFAQIQILLNNNNEVQEKKSLELISV